jgi:hypothetical protein
MLFVLRVCISRIVGGLGGMPAGAEVLWNSYRLTAKMSALFGSGVSSLKCCLRLISLRNSGAGHFHFAALRDGGKVKGYWGACKGAVVLLYYRWMDCYIGRYIFLNAGKCEVSSDEPPVNTVLVPFTKRLICHD